MQFNSQFPNNNNSPLLINTNNNIANTNSPLLTNNSTSNSNVTATQLTNINEEPEYNPNLEKVKGFLGKTLRVTISDNRMFEGIFVCTDNNKNLILSMAQEFRQSNRRRVGLIMIPGKHIKKIEVKKNFTRFGTFT